MCTSAKLQFLCTVLILALTTSVSPVANGQVVGGTIQGTITDTTGAVVPEVKINIENLATGVITTVTSNGDGFYTAPNLLPGGYRITTTHTGFATAIVQITLTVGAQRVVNPTLRVGGATETVRVTSDVADVELASSEISGVVNATTIRELPLNGRDWTQLATLQPGVATVRTQPSVGAGDRGQRGFGTQMTINGGRPAQNNYRLDGISINDYSNAAPGSVLGTDLGADAVSEFSVLSSNYPSEYGRSSGGVINAITRRARMNSMEVPMNFCGTALSTPATILIRSSPRLSAINSGRQLADQSGRTRHSSLGTMKDCGSHWASRKPIRCQLRVHGPAGFPRAT